ncbi:MAG: hypothetical protein JWO60_3088 [Frankiales bacterium]|nr:hypothetical protein [Frankiales bacterium]
MSTPDTNLTRQQGQSLDADHVPTPASGVRGADQADAMDNDPGHGTTTGADGQTPAREALRKDLGERAEGTGEETDAELEQGGAVGATDDPQGGSIQEHGSRP